jgi:hypothetical protein
VLAAPGTPRLMLGPARLTDSAGGLRCKPWSMTFRCYFCCPPQVWCMTALDWGWSVEDTAARLGELSEAVQQWESCALLTATNAAETSPFIAAPCHIHPGMQGCGQRRGFRDCARSGGANKTTCDPSGSRLHPFPLPLKASQIGFPPAVRDVSACSESKADRSHLPPSSHFSGAFPNLPVLTTSLIFSMPCSLSIPSFLA